MVISPFSESSSDLIFPLTQFPNIKLLPFLSSRRRHTNMLINQCSNLSLSHFSKKSQARRQISNRFHHSSKPPHFPLPNKKKTSLQHSLNVDCFAKMCVNKQSAPLRFPQPLKHNCKKQANLWCNIRHPRTGSQLPKTQSPRQMWRKVLRR